MDQTQNPFPFVSIIVPCFNEQATIQLLLDGIYHQTYPYQHMEVVIADGISTDDTRNLIQDFADKNQGLQIQIIENQKRIIPAGVNRAIEAAKGDILIRMDAHSNPNPEYVSQCVSLIQNGVGDNVGGVWEIRPGGKSWMANAIATAAAHPLGVGDAHYRFTDQPQLVDTVPFGAFHRDLLGRIAPPETGPGPYDESLLSNEDYEFNVRVRQAEGKVYLDPAIRTSYYARASLGALAKQYWRYGYWKFRMLRRYPKTVKWRQALPPVFSLSIIVLGIFAIFNKWFAVLLAAELSIYFAILIATSIGLAIKNRKFFTIIGVPLAIATMHFIWGLAFLYSQGEYALNSLIEREKI